MNGNSKSAQQHDRCQAKWIVVVAAMMVGMAGCQLGPVHWNLADKFAGKKDKKDADDNYGTPERMVVIWKDSIFESPTSPPIRGFGGRVYFYDKDEQPVRVDGDVIVYGFNDSSEHKNAEADKKFVFEKSMLQEHYSNTGLGHSYSLWIPWDKAGGENMSISLIPVFRDEAGAIVRGGQTVNVLPGKDPLKSLEADSNTTSSTAQLGANSLTSTPGVQEIPTGDSNAYGSQFPNVQVGHLAIEGSVETSNKGGVRLRTTTISLPADTGARLQKLPQTINPVSYQPRQQPASYSAPQSPHVAIQKPNYAEANITSNQAPWVNEAEPLLEPGRGKPMFPSGQSHRDSVGSTFGKPGSLK